ncbi:hypothetical protein BDZ45DRAFT_798915 [Acephala macrosclerotiorum]|nr:hypothetical protein BDZ45DRAFT_798915 [Acephala macrosclerotiorum]
MRPTLLSLLPALASAQSIECSLISAALSVVITAAPVIGTAQSISAQNSAQASSVGSAAIQSSPIAQRDTLQMRRHLCPTTSWHGSNCKPPRYLRSIPHLSLLQSSCALGYLPKGVFWGVPVSAATATNLGQHRESFEVVIAGSNGYNALATPPSNPGFTGPVTWPGAPDCPVDPVSGISTYIGSKYFAFGLFPGQIQYFSTEVCVSACSAQTAYNFAHAIAGKNPSVCNHVVAYMLNDNLGIPQGVYCAMFTESWDAGYGKVTAAAFGSAQWTVGSAYAYTNATYSASYSPICQGSSCATEYAGGNCRGWSASTC